MHVVEVEGGGGVLTVIHDALERPAPELVGERGPVPLQAVPGAGRGQRGADSRMPVENGPAGVEGQCPDA